MARASGVTAVTIHTRMTRTSWSFLTCTATSTSCARMTSSRIVMLRYRLINESTLHLVYRNLPQQSEIAEHAPGSQHHRSQRIVGDRNRQPGLLADPLVQVFQQRSAAGQHDSPVADV